jgi:cytochrome c-type biogenesis protein CcmH
MIRFRRFFARIAVTVLLLPVFAGALVAQKNARAKEIGGKFLCMCGCTQVLTQCNHVGCTVSSSMLKKVDAAVAAGDSEEKITKDFVKEFGTTVYAEPPKSGFSLLAWWMPTIYLVIGAALVVFVIARWRKVTVSPAGTAGVGASQYSQELLGKARSRAARETED